MARIETSYFGHDLNYRALRVGTPDGVTLSVQDHRPADPLLDDARDVLFIHGYSQAWTSWTKQVAGPLRSRHRLVTFDLRGHGMSDKPDGVDAYRDPRRWADDVSAVIAAAGLDRPVIVAWSYAGRVALDFLASTGPSAISGLVMVAATSTTKDGVLGDATPLLRAMAGATDAAGNIAATAALLRACTAAVLPDDEFAAMLASNMLTPPAVRTALTGRTADYDAVLRALDVPLLAIHGTRDRINTVAMSAHSCDVAPRARMIVYNDCAHLPFWEQAARFDNDLLNFIDTLPRNPEKPQ